MRLSRAASLAATFVALSLSLKIASNPAQAEDEPRPNVVVIVTDDQDYYGLPVMRNLMSYPNGSWVNFTNAYAADSLCAPSRATLFTGQYSIHHRVSHNRAGKLFPEDEALPVWFDNAGYRTGHLGKYHLVRGSRNPAPGWDVWQTRKLTNPIDSYSQLAVDFINSSEEPFLLWLAYDAPHAPAAPPKRYKDADVFVPEPRPNLNELDVSDKPGYIRNRPLFPAYVLAKWRKEQTNAQREALAIDDGVAAIVNALDARGELDSTLIIFTSDNGISWGSHRKIGKWCPYEECSRVPLLIRYPGASGNRVEARYVSNVDIAVTIAEFAGVTPALPQDGRSLLPLLRGAPAGWRNSVLLERHIGDDYYGIVVPGWKYVEFRRGFRELYDLANDPYEMDNVANNPEYGAIQAELAAQLQTILP